MTTKTTSPKVSIIICAYNSAPYISETLDSVLAQGFQDYEIILLNDGSTDNIEEVLKPYRDKIIYRKQENRGLSAARNAAIKLARGKYLTLLDSDDIWFPNYLERMVSLMETNPSVDLFYPNALLFGNHHLSGKLFQSIKSSTRPITVEGVLKHECCIFVAAIFKREILATVGLFDEELRSAEDMDLWLRMLQHGYCFDFTDEVLIKYRKRADSLSGSNSTMFFNYCIKVLQKVIDSEKTTPAQAELATNRIHIEEANRDTIALKQAIYRRDLAVALKYATSVFAIRPSLKIKLVILGLLLAPVAIFRWFRKKGARSDTPEITLIQNKYS